MPLIGCLIALILLFCPRILMLVFYFMDWFTLAFDNWYLPLLGWIFLPFTTLAYLLIVHFNNNVFEDKPWMIIVLVIAVVMDLGTFRNSVSFSAKK